MLGMYDRCQGVVFALEKAYDIALKGDQQLAQGQATGILAR